MRKLLLSAVLSLPLLASAGPVNLLINGSFEDTSAQAGIQGIASGTWQNFLSLPGWTSNANGIEVRHNVSGTAQDGNNFVELDTTRNSVAMQSLSTIAGAMYDLSFYFAARPGTGGMASDTNNISVFWNGVELGLITGVSANKHNWLRYNFSVLGTGGNDSLEFRAAGTSDSYGGSLDNVSLAVPEPGSIALVLGGLLAAAPPAAARHARPDENASGRLRRDRPHRGLGADPIAGVLGLGQVLQVADDVQPHRQQHRQQGGEAGECQ